MGSVGPPEFTATVPVKVYGVLALTVAGVPVTIVNTLLAPEARLLPRLQVTVIGLPAEVHVHPPVPVALVSVNPTGNGKVTFAPVVAS
jgi:hypothetical protein